ncbi:MAG TPA: hypothetical protein ENI51_07885 [Candidatus Atribacteria bacterium]|nr:hypothetical protein [Candidatus Atribacteria bacterium]
MLAANKSAIIVICFTTNTPLKLLLYLGSKSTPWIFVFLPLLTLLLHFWLNRLCSISLQNKNLIRGVKKMMATEKFERYKSFFYCPCCHSRIEWTNICGPCPHCGLSGFSDIKCKNCKDFKYCGKDHPNDSCNRFYPKMVIGDVNG